MLRYIIETKIAGVQLQLIQSITSGDYVVIYGLEQTVFKDAGKAYEVYLTSLDHAASLEGIDIYAAR